MQEISNLHDHMTAFLHGQIKIIKGIQRTNILRLSNSRAPSIVKAA